MSKLLEDSENAKEFIKKNKNLLFEKFASSKIYKPNENPISLFMAGSPGAGKTEYSKRFIERFDSNIVRIDADEIREIIPQYNGANSDVVQGAASIAVDMLYSYTLKNKYNLLLDGTFAKFNIVYRNIERSINKNREVAIHYIYQDPLVAWEFTKKREKLEGRMVPKKVFIESFFNAKNNVKKIKSIFKDKIKVYLIIKDYSNNIKESYLDVHIDSYLKIKYSERKLNEILKDIK
ncbi:MAG: zeta toxin family protein [Candidatus Pacebacteria bacterium]|nr:zeta toxin family protein [Candidatus Paceibacterota bacterium]